MPKRRSVTVLAYASCDTCKKALKWLAANGLDAHVRAIVDAPPTVAELDAWVPASGLPIRKWLNTSGRSYRAFGKEKVDAASERDLIAWLANDGKLVKRPVLVAAFETATAPTVLIGFSEAAYARLLA